MPPNVCGRFLLLTLGDEIVAHFELSRRFAPRPRYNIAPRQEVLTVGQSPDGQRGIATTRWGLVPRWAPDTTKAPINARSETVARLEFFRDSFRERRCLVPASGFYEWEVLPGRKKRPSAFRLKGCGPVGADLLDLALLWSQLHPRHAAPGRRGKAREEALAVLAEAETLCGPSRVLLLERAAHARALGREGEAEAAARAAARAAVAEALRHDPDHPDARALAARLDAAR
jgi:putative SOS response-associated peptidase YedK